MRVLIVDDDHDNRDSLAVLLRLWGHEVCLANDGPSGLERVRSCMPQVVLLDIKLGGGMNGWEVARRLRQQDGHQPCLLVALTGHGREQDIACSFQAGFDAHLTKPADLLELQRLLERAS